QPRRRRLGTAVGSRVPRRADGLRRVGNPAGDAQLPAGRRGGTARAGAALGMGRGTAVHPAGLVQEVAQVDRALPDPRQRRDGRVLLSLRRRSSVPTVVLGVGALYALITVLGL